MMNMGKVSTGLSMSLDGFIAGPNYGPEQPLGEGGMRLFEWYSGGDTEYELPDTEMVFKVSPQSTELLREVDRTMAHNHKCGRSCTLGEAKRYAEGPVSARERPRA
jgi:hypothetical protein